MAAGFGRHGKLPPLLILTFDDLTLKLVCESHLTVGIFLPNLGTLGLCVLELFAMYATDGQTDGQKQRLLPFFPTVGHITSKTNHMHMFIGAVGGMCKVEWSVVTLLIGDNVGQSLGMNSSFGK